MAAERIRHGLRANAVGFGAGLAIAIASTAPAYSLAVTLGLIVRELGPGSVAAPAVLVLSFVPMLFIAVAFDRLNRVVPDCGTTFAWVARAMGPWAGWIAGWATVAAGTIVMASLAQVSGLYTFRLLGFAAAADSRAAVAVAGAAWLALLTWICARGIETSVRVQYALLAIELLALVAFSVSALAGHPAAAPAASWFHLGTVAGPSALAGGVLAAVFLYWGWETALSMNEETRRSSVTPGRAGLAGVVLLLVTYVAVAVAAQSVRGPGFLAAHADDVFAALAPDVLPAPWSALLVLGVITSTIAAAQTTLIPTARTVLSMAAAGALPPVLARVHPRFRTPHVATLVIGAAGCAWFVALSAWSNDVLKDSVTATELLVALAYALTGYACPLLYLRRGRFSVRDALLLVALPLVGAAALTWVFVESCLREVGVPLTVGVAVMAAGGVLMAGCYRRRPEFFRSFQRAP